MEVVFLASVTVQGIGIPRLEGEEYLSIVDEFMEVVHTCWPKAIVQVYWLRYQIFNCVHCQ